MVNYNPLYVQNLMDKCGVAWFKMNESAGNLLDSKGSFVGVNNATSVVAGISGNGRSFNGTSSYVSFPAGMIPIGKKSVRFKMKLAIEGVNNYSWILSSGHNGESSFNILLDFRSASKGIRFTLRDASGTTGEIYTIVTNYFVDNQWHDYLFTWDGTTNVSGVKVYCDGIISSTETAKKNETVIINKPLILGNIPALGSAEYFNGQLDELEIYNDVIQPFASKILLSSGGKYSLKDSTVYKMETDNEKNFLNYGADLITNFNRYVTKQKDVKSTSALLESGKTLEHKIDMSKRRVDKITLG